jgi:hypothetical protein
MRQSAEIIMTAILSGISSRHKTFVGAVASPADFTLENGREVAPEFVLSTPDWSLYTIDVEKSLAMFVELPPDTDLAAAPFVYMTQFDLARQAVVMPLHELEPLSQLVPLPKNFGMLFSTGRCGSTLASRILAQVPGVWSLSEPDSLENLAFARFLLPQEKMVPLLRAATRLLFRPPPGRYINNFVVKPRSESIVQAPEYALALPDSRNVFMYRDALGFVNSFHQFTQKILGSELFNSSDSWKIIWLYLSVNAPHELMNDYFPDYRSEVDYVKVQVIGWIIRLKAYDAALKHGINMQPLHYNDLNNSRQTATVRLLEALAIPLEHLNLAMQGFAGDSQEGTGGDRALPAVPLDETQRQTVLNLLKRWGHPDYKTSHLSSQA